jgi:hypothetical protein
MAGPFDAETSDVFPNRLHRPQEFALLHGESAQGEIDWRTFLQKQQSFKECDGIFASRDRDGNAVAIANHLESMNRFPDFPQQGLFEIHWN